MEKPLEFKARKEVVNGKEILVIDPISQVTKNPDGSQDVTMIMPSLQLINDTKALHGIE
ncbi:MAG: hypothetical protein GY928_25765 [Colwellia sp.]|nr:hypothetical protein [Colwellia sp.]